MASIKKDIDKPFSRMMNDLAELQGWWPAYCVNDGIGGLSVDPMLYRTQFGPNSIEDQGRGFVSEANTPGMRVEAINNDGTQISGGTAPTIQIVGSGTLDARAIITHNDASTTTVRFVAPSLDGNDESSATWGSTTYSIATQAGAGNQTGSGRPRSGPYRTTGPFPVFLTLQELADLLDSTMHHSANGANYTMTQKAWLPHGSLTSATTTAPAIGSDPRDTGQANLPAQNPIRATVFMPMMLDNNQLAASQQNGATPSNDIVRGRWDGTAGNDTGYYNFVSNGMTRHSQSPDATGVRYKFVHDSGDNRIGDIGSFQSKMVANTNNTDDFTNPDICPDSSAYGGPSYRMRSALACFLKDGTYALTNGGALIQYTYDSTRKIGGYRCTTVHAVWDGRTGIALTDAQADGDNTPLSPNPNNQTSAQIFPLYDFIQGPFVPPAQGSNFDYDNTDGNYPAWLKQEATNNTGSFNLYRPQPRSRLLRPNPLRSRIYAYQRLNNSDVAELKIWVESPQTASDCTNEWPLGMPIFINGMGGAGGTDSAIVHWNGINDGGYNANNKYSAGRNMNGWWITTTVSTPNTIDRSTVIASDTGTFFGSYIIIRINTGDGSGIIADASPVAAGAGAWVAQGIMGGTECLPTATAIERGINPYLITSPPSMTYSISPFSGVVMPYGAGFLAGVNCSNTSVPSTVGHRATFPGRIDMSPSANPSGALITGQYEDNSKFVPRGIELVPADDISYLYSPTANGVAGGTLRLPPPQSGGISMLYYASTSGTALTAGAVGQQAQRYTDVVEGNTFYFYDSFPRSLTHKWRSRGLHTPLFSKMDTLTGRHGWDTTKPYIGTASGATSPITAAYGRNRPFPIHERCGTRLGYGPLTRDFYSDYGWVKTFGSTAMVGDRITPGQPTTKTGLTEIGCSPIWLDFEMEAYLPIRKEVLTIIEFDTGEEDTVYGRHGMFRDPLYMFNQGNRGFAPLWDGASALHRTGDQSAEINPPPIEVRSHTLAYFWGGTDWFSSNWDDVRTTPANGWPFDTSKQGGFGAMGVNQVGGGTQFELAEGYHTIRSFFNEAGMTLIVDGTTMGTDPNCAKPVWGVSLSVCASGGASNSDGTSTDSNNNRINAENLTLYKQQADLQIDTISMRHIPSPQMLPFKVHTQNQKVSGIARYTSLTVEADNVRASTGMNIKATLMTPVDNGVSGGNPGGPSVEGGSPISGFEDVDLGFVGGIGSMDLTGLPASAIADGFVVRWEFYVPSSDETDLHPIDWSSTPIIRNWTIEYDIAPTASVACIGNTYNGDIVAPIDTKVGHIVSFRGTATTTDIDRTVSKIKFDFGDGSATDFLSFTDQTLTTNTYDVGHSYLQNGSYDVKVFVQDDVGNQTESTSISIVVADAAPVAVLRAVPSLIRAGSAITFDAGASYDINAGGSIATYTFSFGDGSSNVSGSASSVQHTYATAGEYQATLVCVDAGGTSSQTASVVVKVLPATLVVPLVFNTKPRGFKRNRRASLSQNTVLDSVYPEITDRGNRSDEFSLDGMFLKETANDDIAFVEELMLSGSLVEFMWEEVNYQGTPTGKTFVGRILSFDYNRAGGAHGQTPYSIVLVREAGLGA
jgi:hypothetical protein